MSELSLKTVGKNARICLSRWFGSQKCWVVLLAVMIFSYYIYWPVTQTARILGKTVCPAVFVFYLSHFRMLVFQGGVSLFLFSDIMTMDEFACWNISRTGRLNFILGQLVYVFLLSGMYVLFMAALSLVFVLPAMGSFKEWGTIMYTMAADVMKLMSVTGLEYQFFPSASLMDIMSPVRAELLSMLFMWLQTSFMGCLVLVCTVYKSRSVGVSAGGILTAFSMFSMFMGNVTFGRWLTWLSPVSWSDLGQMDWFHSHKLPTPMYAALFLIISMLIMGVCSCIGFIHNDIKEE